LSAPDVIIDKTALQFFRASNCGRILFLH
jgi:hypothetical protein